MKRTKLNVPGTIWKNFNDLAISFISSTTVFFSTSVCFQALAYLQPSLWNDFTLPSPQGNFTWLIFQGQTHMLPPLRNFINCSYLYVLRTLYSYLHNAFIIHCNIINYACGIFFPFLTKPWPLEDWDPEFITSLLIEPKKH